MGFGRLFAIVKFTKLVVSSFLMLKDRLLANEKKLRGRRARGLSKDENYTMPNRVCIYLACVKRLLWSYGSMGFTVCLNGGGSFLGLEPTFASCLTGGRE